MNDQELRDLLSKAQQLWEWRFDRLIAILRECDHNDLADLAFGVKFETFNNGPKSGLKPKKTDGVHIYDLVLNVIRTEKEVTVKELVQKTHYSYSYIADILAQLVKQGKVIRHGFSRGSYYTIKNEIRAVS